MGATHEGYSHDSVVFTVNDNLQKGFCSQWAWREQVTFWWIPGHARMWQGVEILSGQSTAPKPSRSTACAGGNPLKAYGKQYPHVTVGSREGAIEMDSDWCSRKSCVGECNVGERSWSALFKQRFRLRNMTSDGISESHMGSKRTQNQKAIGLHHSKLQREHMMMEKIQMNGAWKWSMEKSIII